MSEPRTAAAAWTEIVPGVLHWTVHDDRIDFRSEAYAVADGDGFVLIDPLPLAPVAVAAFGAVHAIVLTSGAHQRAAWSLRAATGAAVSAPRGATGLDGAPDRVHDADDELPGALRAVHAPGPKGPHFALARDLAGGGRVLFTGDLLARGPRGPAALLPEAYLADPDAARRTAALLADLGPTVLALGHGAPVLEDAEGVLRRAAGR